MRYWLYLLLAFSATSIANAADSQVAPPITLEQVIVNVLEKNPQFGINDFESRAAAARIRQAQQKTPYEVRVGVENVIGTGDYSVLDRSEATFSLVRILESEKKVSSRSELATAQSTLLRNEQDGKRLDLLATVTEQFIHVVIDQHRLRIAQEQLELTQHTHDVVTARVNAGKNHAAEARRTAIAVARAEIELEHAQHELAVSRLKLSATWGDVSPKFGSAEAQLFSLSPVASFDQLESLLSNNPELIRLATEERVAQAHLNLAQSQRNPNLELSGGIRHFNDTGDAALVFSVGMPFGARSRAQPQIDEMQNLAERQPLRYEQTRLMLYSTLYQLYQELLHAQAAFETLSERIIPEAEQAAKDYEDGYQRGRFSLLELNEAQQVLLHARLEKVMTAANYHRLKIEIERLTGAALHLGEQP